MRLLRPRISIALWLFWIFAAFCVAGLFLRPSAAEAYYRSPVFFCLMASIGALALLCSQSPSWRGASRVASHLGFILLFLGAVTSGLLGRRGVLTLAEGEESDRFWLSETETQPLPGIVRLERFEIETYGDNPGQIVIAEEAAGTWNTLGEMQATQGAAAEIAGWSLEVLSSGPSPMGAGRMATVRATRGEDSLERPLFSEMQALHSELPDGRRMVFVYEPDVKSYRSTLQAGGTGQEEKIVVEVNRPGRWGGWSFYQSSYNAQEGRLLSTLEVVKDPGVPWVFSGYAFLVFGAAISLKSRKVPRG